MRSLRKKGDLSLSVNAIVILILAVVLLAFGLSFITKLLSKGESSLSGMFPAPEVQPTSTKPIAMPDTVLVTSGSTARMSVAILNTQTTPLTGSLTIGGTGCPTLAGTDYVSGTLPSGGIAPGEIGSVKLLINGRPNYVDNSICTVTIGTLSGSFFLTTKGSI